MILQRYILKDLVAVFLLSLAAITLISVVAFLYQTLRSYEQLGLSFAMQFIVLNMGATLPYTLPVAATMATTFVFSRLSANNELLAMKAAGIHIHKIVTPAILFSLGLCLISLYFYEVITPQSYNARRVAIRSALKAVLKSPPPDAGSRPVGDYRISYQEFRDGAFQLPLIIEFSKDGRRLREYQAREARIAWDAKDQPELVLEDTTIRTFENGELVSTSTGERSEIKGKLLIDDTNELFKRPAGMTREELLKMAATHPQPHQRNRAQFEYFARYARSTAPLILVLVGLVVGTAVTKGAKMIGLGVSLPILLMYFVLSLVTDTMSDTSKLPMPLLAFSPLMIMGALGLFPLVRLYRN